MMGFLQNIFGKGDKNVAEEMSELPTRNRTFSASAFRDAEIARENEAYHRREQAQIDASTVLSPAVAPVAEVLIAQQEQAEPTFNRAEDEVGEHQAWDEAPVDETPTSFEPAEEPFEPTGFEPQPQSFDPEPQGFEPEPQSFESEAPTFELEPVAPAPSVSENDPMEWEEAVGWLSQRSAESRNFVAQYWNWEHDLRVVEFLVQQPDLDPGVAAGILWLTAANEDIFPWGDDEPQGEFDQAVAKITHMVGHRFDAGDFPPMAHGFDDSWDCERLKERLVELHEESRINWNPQDIPTSSGAQMMSFDDIPADERDEVIAFLARHGVH